MAKRLHTFFNKRTLDNYLLLFFILAVVLCLAGIFCGINVCKSIPFGEFIFDCTVSASRFGVLCIICCLWILLSFVSGVLSVSALFADFICAFCSSVMFCRFVSLHSDGLAACVMLAIAIAFFNITLSAFTSVSIRFSFNTLYAGILPLYSLL